MFAFFKKLLNAGSNENLSQLIQKGAVIIDVRTPHEFAAGHHKNSINIPLDRIEKGAEKYKKDQPLVLCCQSGMRSANARRKLKSMGYQQVINAGSWTSLKKNNV